ncbi:MAG TPA: hypothetical protein VJ804_01905, partial [Acidimicrobiales bacterium]|nr:hypothetical protein [Acidimicrobiales bacterium]
VLGSAGEVLGEIRRAKSEAKRSMRAAVDRVVVAAPADRLAALAPALDDVRAAGVVQELEVTEAEVLGVTVELAPEG